MSAEDQARREATAGKFAYKALQKSKVCVGTKRACDMREAGGM